MVMKYLAEVRSRMSADSMQVLHGSDVNMSADGNKVLSRSDVNMCADGNEVLSGSAVQDECWR